MSRWKERAWKLALFGALLAITVVALSSRPPSTPVDGVAYGDKLQHVAAFAVLGLLAGRAYADRPRWGIVVALAFYGLCIEIAQARTPGRAFELLDAVANTLGACSAFLVPRVPARDPAHARARTEPPS